MYGVNSKVLFYYDLIFFHLKQLFLILFSLSIIPLTDKIPHSKKNEPNGVFWVAHTKIAACIIYLFYF